MLAVTRTKETPTVPGRPDAQQRRDLRQLLRRQSEEAIQFSAAFGARHDLHQTDVAALAAISEASSQGAPIGPARLARELHLSRPATTALIDRLERVGHVARRIDPDDRRRTVLEIQPAATELAAAYFGRLGDAYDGVMNEFTTKELEVVATFLRRVTETTVGTRQELEPDFGSD